MESSININYIYAIIGVIFLGLLFIDGIRFKLKKLLRFVFYENLVVTILRNKFLQLVLPGVSGAYFLCLDVWGDKWKFISENQVQHEFAFSILIGISLLVLVIRGIADHIEGNGSNPYKN